MTYFIVLCALLLYTNANPIGYGQRDLTYEEKMEKILYETAECLNSKTELVMSKLDPNNLEAFFAIAREAIAQCTPNEPYLMEDYPDIEEDNEHAETNKSLDFIDVNKEHFVDYSEVFDEQNHEGGHFYEDEENFEDEAFSTLYLHYNPMEHIKEEPKPIIEESVLTVNDEENYEDQDFGKKYLNHEAIEQSKEVPIPNIEKNNNEENNEDQDFAEKYLEPEAVEQIKEVPEVPIPNTEKSDTTIDGKENHDDDFAKNHLDHDAIEPIKEAPIPNIEKSTLTVDQTAESIVEIQAKPEETTSKSELELSQE